MADKVNLQIDQGSTFNVYFNVKDPDTNEPVNLTGYTAAGQMRKTYAANNAVNFNLQLYANGTIKTNLTANQTTAIIADTYVYDIEITNPEGEVSRIVEGTVIVTPNVTR